MKRKWIIAGLVVLALLWAGNLYYFHKYSLSKPLFLHHYYNLRVVGDSVSFELYYLVSNHDADKSVSLRLPANGDSISLRTIDSKQYTYKMHTLKKVMVEISKRDQPLLTKQDEFAFSEVSVNFSGSESVTPIGHIRIDLRPFDKNTILPVQSGHSGGPEGSRSMNLFETASPLSVKDIKFPIADNILQQAGQIDVQFNEQGWKGWNEVRQNLPQLTADNSHPLRIEWRLKGKPGYMYSENGSLTFVQPDGSAKAGSFSFHSDPPYDESDILEIVKEGRK